MSLLFRERGQTGRTGSFPSRMRKVVGNASVTDDSSLKHSAVWAALRLRADLLSSMPVDAYRKVQGIDVEIQKPPVLLNPGGDEWDMASWLWATQFDLDRVGNAFGVITERDKADRPAVIQLADHSDVVVKVDRKSKVTYKVKNKEYEARDIWHERQNRPPGSVVGLSAIAYAAYSIGLHLSAQQFAIEWFTNGGQVPGGHLKNTATTLTNAESDVVKERFKLSVADRDLFVTGKDWEYKTINSVANDAKFIESQDLAAIDVARFFAVPADLIDLAIKGQSVTYANISQRNQQFLIMHLWPTVRRRERALGQLLPEPRYVRFNTDAILQLDPETKAKVLGQQIRDRILAPSEARSKYNLEPFTAEQIQEFEVLFPKGQPASKSTTIGE